jgi:hypothetical protein
MSAVNRPGLKPLKVATPRKLQQQKEQIEQRAQQLHQQQQDPDYEVPHGELHMSSMGCT